MTELDKIRWLRFYSSAQYPACKHALIDAGGDHELALERMHAAGLSPIPRPIERSPHQGIISSISLFPEQPKQSWWKRLWSK